MHSFSIVPSDDRHVSSSSIQSRSPYFIPQAQANARLVRLITDIRGSNPFPSIVVRSTHAVTIVSQYPYRHIQIVLRLYKSPAEVLMGFDVDCCAVGYATQRTGRVCLCARYQWMEDLVARCLPRGWWNKAGIGVLSDNSTRLLSPVSFLHQSICLSLLTLAPSDLFPSLPFISHPFSSPLSRHQV